MSRRASSPADDRDEYEGWPPVDSPEFDAMAKEYWAAPHGSPLRNRPIPVEVYRWL